jgi:peptidoglycan-associated lipoprotein
MSLFLKTGVRGTKMNLKIVAAFAAALLLGACASSEKPATDNGSSTAGGGGTAGQAAPGSVEEFQVSVGDRVFFDYDSYEIRPDAQDTLRKQGAWLQQYRQYTVTIEGHCDERGTREYNLALGERRANSVKNYLVALGVDANRVQTISYGKERPENPGHDEIAFSQNRRGVTVLSQ